MIDQKLQKVMLAALESLKSSLSEGAKASFLDGSIAADDISGADIEALESRIKGERPQRVVINLDGGLIESIGVNMPLMAPLEVYTFESDLEGVDDEDVSTLTLNDGEGPDTEIERYIRKESAEYAPAMNIDDNLKRVFGGL